MEVLDALGRVVPHRPTLVGMLEVPAVREIFAAFREVPAGFVIRDDMLRPKAVVCPCGLAHLFPSPAIREADCGRFFVSTSRRVLVWRPESAANSEVGAGREDGSDARIAA